MSFPAYSNHSEVGPNVSLICDELTPEELEMYTVVSFWFECVLQSMVGAVGFFANALAIPILCSREMSSIFNRLLVFLAIFDNLYIVCSVLEGLRKHTEFSQAHEYAFGYFLYQFHNFVLCGSIYVTLSLALERFKAVWRPVEYHNRCKGANPWRRIAYYIIPVVVFSAIFNIPKFLEVEFIVSVEDSSGSDCDSSSDCVVNRTLASPTALRLNDVYVILYVNAARLFVQGIIPFVLLTILNYRIYWVISRRRKMINRPAVSSTTMSAATLAGSVSGGASAARLSSAQRKANEAKQAVVLFIIVLLFFFCHTPRFVLNVHEFLTLESLRVSLEHDCNGVPLWALLCASVSHCLMTLNCSVNFFIYCLMCKTFRRTLCRLLRRRCVAPVASVCCCCSSRIRRNLTSAPADLDAAAPGTSTLMNENGLLLLGEGEGGGGVASPEDEAASRAPMAARRLSGVAHLACALFNRNMQSIDQGSKSACASRLLPGKPSDCAPSQRRANPSVKECSTTESNSLKSASRPEERAKSCEPHSRAGERPPRPNLPRHNESGCSARATLLETAV